jgi:hypothetical protein
MQIFFGGVKFRPFANFKYFSSFTRKKYVSKIKLLESNFNHMNHMNRNF